MSSFPCPKCHEPVSKMTGKCWHCGWNTASYEENILNSWPSSGKDLKVLGVKVGGKEYDVVEKRQLTGLSSSYYELPEGCKELQDLIEYKNMNFARGNIFKATYRLGDKPGTDQIYDYEKIIWFAQREIQRLKGAKE